MALLSAGIFFHLLQILREPTHPQPIFFSNFYTTYEAEIMHATLAHKNKMIQDVWDICLDSFSPIMDFENGVIVKIYKS